MKNINWYQDNSNGVSMYKSEYIGGGIYDCRISAENIEVNDTFNRIGSEFKVVEIKDSHPHKVDKSLTVYDCLLKDESWRPEPGYLLHLPVIRLPKPEDFDISPK